jgi:glycerophosphoryl diester phosphodiesterase
MAHRGGAALAPENTLLAFRQAIEWWGADVLELDVQPTRDGEVVVIHDPLVDRTTDGAGPVASHTLAELRRLDAGHRFSPDGGRTLPYRGCGVGIPTLAEVLDAFPGMRVNVEVKDGRAQARTREVIAAAHAEGRVLIAAAARGGRSLFLDYRGAVSASEEEMKAFYLLHRIRAGRLFVPRIDAFQMPFRHNGREVVTERLVRDAHAHNLAVHVWTVDDPGEMRRLLERGVDGIVTDRPDRLARVLHAVRGRPLPPGPPQAEMPPWLEWLLLA